MSAPSLNPTLPKIAWAELQKGELLGHGSYGDVYRGKWSGKEVAIKELHLKKLSAQLLTDLDNETRIMAACQSERIVRLFCVCLDIGHYAMIMEYMPKGSLYQLLQDSKVDLPWALRWRLALEIGEGLDYLHQKAILHRDLKSMNILLDAHNHPKITDFGLSKIKLETSSTSTKSKESVGTVRWQAPELFKRKAVHTKASDVYSYGMLLWEIASRKIPFSDAANEQIVISWINQGEKEEIPSDCPSAYGDLVQRCWSQEPNERPLMEIVLTALRSAMPPETLPAPEKAWHFDPTTKKNLEGKKYELLPASSKDFQKVLSFYAHHPMPGYEIASVQVIHNPGFNRSFELHMAKLQERHQNPAFAPKWSWDSHPEWRQKVHELFETMAKPYTDPDYPAVKLLPLWHGTKAEILDSIFRVGFANLASTDAGFFGKGLYSAYEAEYAQRVYSQGALLLNWVAIYSPYPTIDGDMSKLAEKANYQNYDAHFVPVVPKTSNPHESNYFPTKPHQKHTYTEVVVFDSAACLPRYLVQLQPTMTKQLAPKPSTPTPSAPQPTPPKPAPSPKIEPLKPAAPKTLPFIAFGKAQWERFFGDVGIEPTLPADIHQILNSPCPFWPGKKVSETHLLTLIPQSVNGTPFTLDSLEELIQHPKQGTATKYRYYYKEFKKKYGAKTLGAAHWVLMTRDVIPGSRNKSYTKQQQLIEKVGRGYAVPLLLEATAAILMAYFAKGERLYVDNPWTYTRCQEDNDGYHSVCGGFGPSCLYVYDNLSGDCDDNGVAASWKF